MPPTKNQGGRPRKLEIDTELQGKIMAMIRAGMYPERAAVAAGVSERSHYDWQAKGLDEREHRETPGKTPRKTMQVYLDYVDALDKAVAEAEFLLLGKVQAGGAGGADLRWVMERRFRDRWGAQAAKAQPPAAPSAGPTVGNVTPLQQMAQRREQRRVKKTS